MTGPAYLVAGICTRISCVAIVWAGHVPVVRGQKDDSVTLSLSRSPPVLVVAQFDPCVPSIRGLIRTANVYTHHSRPDIKNPRGYA